MKPLLRAVLIVDALLLLVVGGLFLLTPWRALFDALQLVTVDPPMIGQAFGVALLGLAWLALHAAIDGDLTSSVARAVSHVNWLIGALALIWVIALRNPSLSGFGQLVSVAAGAVFVIAGFGGARLTAAVRRREKAAALEARDAKRSAAAESAPALRETRVEPAVDVATPAATSTPTAVRAPVVQPTIGAGPGAVIPGEARSPLQD